MPSVSLKLLEQQNAQTSNAIIEHYSNNDLFQKLAKYEGDMTIARDKEDDTKLEKGIKFAQQKGVLDPQFKPSPYHEIDVLGKTPDEVADEIIQLVNAQKKGKGGVICLVGLSGTGKVSYGSNNYQISHCQK